MVAAVVARRIHQHHQPEAAGRGLDFNNGEREIMSEPNLSVMEYQIKATQVAIDKMLPIVEGLVVTTNNLVITQRQTNERIAEHERAREADSSKIETLWDNRSQFKGGYATIVALLCVVSGLIGAYAALRSTIH